MRIAVVGSGVSGLGAAWALKDLHDVVLFEKDDRLGGHANTLEIDYDGTSIPVDTGFIVFNSHNYPNLVNLLAHLEVPTHASDMSFSVSDPNGLEWSSNGLGGLFAWKRNLARPAFLRMLSDIVRFSARARGDLRNNRLREQTLEAYVRQLGLSDSFLRGYLLPMGAAIWSTPERDMLDYPAASFLRFFDNHRLLHAKRPEWRSIIGGSRRYVAALKAALGQRLRTAEEVVSVVRTAEEVRVHTRQGQSEGFDHVILACHSDEALAILGDNALALEQRALQAIRYAPNTAFLHRDPRLMPRRKSAWASWNYLRDPRAGDRVTVSYWMNLLQNIDHAHPLFVTLNPSAPPDPGLTFAQVEYAHPQFDLAALQAQREIAALQGQTRTSFAGAWLGHGFHEDGLASGLAAARALGGRPAWETSLGESLSELPGGEAVAA